MFQSAPGLREFYRRAGAAAEQITSDFELIFINDGSPDDSLQIAVRLSQEDPRVRVVDLSRNFGHHKALMTALTYAVGELVFLIDCDLEVAPGLLAQFYATMLGKNADVVYGVQRSRKGSTRESVTRAIFYTAFNLLADHKIPRNLMFARLMSRRYVDALIAHREREVYIQGLWSIAGFVQVGLPVDKNSKGSTTYRFWRKFSTMVNAVTSFSNAPLRYVLYLGSLVMLISSIYGVYLFLRVMIFGSDVPGWASLMVSIWLLGGTMIFCIGVVGIYVSKIFSETKQRPYTVVRELYPPEETAPAALR